MLPSRPVGFVLHGLVLVVGALAGLLGSFVHALRLGGVPVGLVCALALSASAFVTGRLVTGTRSGAAAAALGWLVPLLLLSAPRPEGDLVVSGGLLGYCWLVGGMVAAGVVIAWPYAGTAAPSARPDARR